MNTLFKFNIPLSYFMDTFFKFNIPPITLWTLSSNLIFFFVLYGDFL